jgi:peptidase E
MLGAMAAVSPTILATSMGFNRSRVPWRPGPVFGYAFELARAGDRPRVCFVATAGGDQAGTLDSFYGAFAGTGVVCSHLALFDKPNVPDLRGHLVGQDVVWVDRGSAANLLALWRLHGLDEALRECWQAGVVLAGESAGSLCWHVAGTTDSFGGLSVFSNGLGFLPFSNTVHYSERRDAVHGFVASGELPSGFGTDAGAGLVFRGTELVEAVTDRGSAGAYWVERRPDGTVREERLEVRLLR